MGSRGRNFFIVIFSAFVGGLATRLVEWNPMAEFFLAFAVTMAVAVALLLAARRR